MGTLICLVLAFAAGAFVATWIMHPGFRDRVRGMTAGMVAALGAVAYAFGRAKQWLP